MNEKIKLLCREKSDYWMNHYDRKSKADMELLYQDIEKFAELIVRECAEQSMSIGRYNTPSGITPDSAIAISVGLKKHFGVEE